MTSNLLKSAILLDAMAAIVPGFGAVSDVPGTAKKNFTIHYHYLPIGHSDVQGAGEIRVVESEGHLETYRGQSPAFIGALNGTRQAADRCTTELPWMKDAWTSVDSDGDELITLFGSSHADNVRPGLDCGTYVVLGGTGKFKRFSATGAYACATAQAAAGEVVATFAMELMHKGRHQPSLCRVSKVTAMNLNCRDDRSVA